jgi:hypothetical protein
MPLHNLCKFSIVIKLFALASQNRFDAIVKLLRHAIARCLIPRGRIGVPIAIAVIHVPAAHSDSQSIP